MENQTPTPASAPVTPSGNAYAPPTPLPITSPSVTPPPVPPAKKRSWMLIMGIVIVLLLLGGGYLYFMNMQTPEQKIQPVPTVKPSPTTIPTPKTVSTESAAMMFDAEKAKVGDTIGAMKITEINGLKAEKPSSQSASVQFSGQVLLTGEIVYYEPGGFMAEAVCMNNFDTASLAVIPKMKSDTREAMVCFNDLAAAKKNLVINNKGKARATVMINNYRIVYYPSEVFNTADFVSLVK